MPRAAWRSRAIRKVGDIVEAFYGPDPGLTRLQMAGRSVLSATIALSALAMMNVHWSMPIAGIALGLMVSIFSTMMVRDPGKGHQAVTIALLMIPSMLAITISAVLAPWQWALDLAFVALVVGITLARQAGPRGMAMGMTAFISYFIGAILKPHLAQLPYLAFAVSIGLGCSALVRFVILPPMPRFSFRQSIRHIERRVSRVLDAVQANLQAEDPSRFGSRAYNRMHREMARLNDAIVAAQGEAEGLGGAENQPLDALSDALFRVDLAAERLIRSASFRPPPPQARETVLHRVGALQDRLETRSLSDDANEQTNDELLSEGAGGLAKAVDTLEAALSGLKRAAREALEASGSPDGGAPQGRSPEGRSPEGRSPKGSSSKGGLPKRPESGGERAA